MTTSIGRGFSRCIKEGAVFEPCYSYDEPRRLSENSLPYRQLLLRCSSSCIHAVVRRQQIGLKIRFCSANSPAIHLTKPNFYPQFSAIFVMGAILGQPPRRIPPYTKHDQWRIDQEILHTLRSIRTELFPPDQQGKI